MCLSIPGKILAIKGNMAEIEIAGNIYQAGTQLMEEVQEGDLVLIHSGFIIQKLSPEEADESEKLLRDILNTEQE
jgi:hydrogenase expression/formation protein HypC